MRMLPYGYVNHLQFTEWTIWKW